MIYEIANITVHAGQEAAFEQGAAQAVPLFQRAQGCLSFELQRGIEQPSQYRLVVGWQTLEDHTVHFRNSANFQAWRALVGHCFAQPPHVEHVATAVRGF